MPPPAPRATSSRSRCGCPPPPPSVPLSPPPAPPFSPPFRPLSPRPPTVRVRQLILARSSCSSTSRGSMNPRDAMDRQVQRAVREAIERADLVLHVVPAERTYETCDAFELPGAAAVLNVRSKCDRVLTNPDRAAARFGAADCGQRRHRRGLNTLARAILDRLGDRAVSVQAELLALQPRHEAALDAAGRSPWPRRRSTWIPGRASSTRSSGSPGRCASHSTSWPPSAASSRPTT